MSMEIRYFTKSKKGNTYKLATFIATKLNLKALDVLNDLTNKTDILILYIFFLLFLSNIFISHTFFLFLLCVNKKRIESMQRKRKINA